MSVRHALGFSQRAMAEELGVVHGAVGLWETEKRKIPGPVLKLIELYERELGLEALPKAKPALDRLDSTWLSRTAKISGTGAKIVGKVFIDGLRKISCSESDAYLIRAKTQKAVAKQIVETFGSLKGLPHKLGQLISYMDVEALPEVRDMYAELQHLTPPMKAATIAEVIVEEFKKTPNQLFDEWSPEPFAAASIGQVHKALTKDGREVAVKVQYPGIYEIIQSDLKNAAIIDRMGAVIVRNHESGNILEELTERFLDECDYTLEAVNQMEIRKIHSDNPKIIIPEVVDELSTRRVLTMEYFEGERFQEFRETATQKAKNDTACTIWDHAFVSAIGHGVFNGDPHPGNYLFKDGKVIFLDYGCVKRIPQNLYKHWKNFLYSIATDNQAGVNHEVVATKIAPDPNRFDFDMFYKLMRDWYYPCYCDKPFTFTRDFVSLQWKEMMEKFPKIGKIRFPKELLFFNQLRWGLYSILADLGVTANWSERFLNLLQ
jgi:predicted unusual protein kinase regulating ubiquinone biosynthesis (AarF/ABC1/UbiB family)